jgi:hypothetical protein
MTACGQLDETDADFDISGLGKPSWGKDVGYAVMEPFASWRNGEV